MPFAYSFTITLIGFVEIHNFVTDIIVVTLKATMLSFESESEVAVIVNGVISVIKAYLLPSEVSDL
jgi:hypothetical protein